MTAANDDIPPDDALEYARQSLEKVVGDQWVNFPTTMLRALVRALDDHLEFMWLNENEAVRLRAVDYFKAKIEEQNKAKIYEFPGQRRDP